jgi:hypothetical protein
MKLTADHAPPIGLFGQLTYFLGKIDFGQLLGKANEANENQN